MKLGLVGSSGGHLTHLYLLKEFWEQEEEEDADCKPE